MKAMVLTAIASFFGMALTHFGYQLLTSDPQWGVAADRSFNQFVALVVFVGLMSPKMRRLLSKLSNK